ncbi:DUF5701 family protein [Streptomyces sp. NBC_01591]|uniref:DUF5701 family protein n=1 Tax=Streptomyces sp. NBC_01591 TaxID=2975888 RepID=UPI002DD83049|nr:DUF5701 family protein [Streptomyces sp. NBC_01591]WSD66343.1 DUF5701 family protein [Streptomyces sp. NBC_01591]
MPAELHTLPSIAAQAERLIELGVHELGGFRPAELRSMAAETRARAGLLVVGADRVPASALAPLLRHRGKPGFVVVDMPDIDQFSPIEPMNVPDEPIYVVEGLDRGDHMANWSPDEALPAIVEGGRTPLLLVEAIHWVLQQPAVLERGHCFMTIGSRLRKANGTLDARTPALWISNGTGRDGRDNRNAPKVGWCWEGNRHTWLGFASATTRAVA